MSAGGSEDRLEGRRILIVEDDFYTATDLAREVALSGATVIGPFRDAAESLRAVGSARPDAALVDLNLGEGPDLTVAAALRERNVPFLFVTGYGEAAIPAAFADIPRVEKPAISGRATQLLRRMLDG
jgi:ActR/RegA family two-component response regulator